MQRYNKSSNLRTHKYLINIKKAKGKGKGPSRLGRGQMGFIDVVLARGR